MFLQKYKNARIVFFRISKVMNKTIGIALTGGSGHLGGVLLPMLINQGFRVRALVRNHQAHFPEQVEQVLGDLDSKESLQALVQGMNVLIHSAALISVSGDPHGLVHKTNVLGTKQVLNAAREAGLSRFIYIGSVHAYQNRPHLERLDESRPMVVHGGAYDRSKSEAQRWVLAQNQPGFETLALCPTSMIGPPDLKPSLLGQAIHDIAAGKIPAVFPGGFDFCDVRDVAQAILNAIHAGRPGQAYLLGGRWYSMRDMGKHIGAVIGKPIRLPEIPFWLGKLLLPFSRIYAKMSGQKTEFTAEALDILRFGPRLVSSDKAKRELNYHCRDLSESLNGVLKGK